MNLGPYNRAAATLGISVAEYERHLACGERWCWRCRQWLASDGFYIWINSVGRRVYQRDCIPCRRAATLAGYHRRKALRGERAA